MINEILKQQIIRQIIDIDDEKTLRKILYRLSEDTLNDVSEEMNKPTKTATLND
ncbi:MAG: hypothetical protein JKY08_03200 [Flavobacteriaceae bacterium]|nr:hypothetical protein [Flavobacteriaceae bacterium]